MIRSTCRCCGGEVLLPDPPPRTKEENIEFRKRWDDNYTAAQRGES